jgi:cholesterol transport system auxiliary component
VTHAVGAVLSSVSTTSSWLSRHTSSLGVVALTVALAGGVLGCALTSKGTPLSPRVFRPTTVSGDLSTAAAKTGTGLSLRLGRVRGAADLREPIAFRVSEYEVGYYEDRRWGERPEAYVKRALSEVFFGREGLTEIIAGAGPTLEVEVLSFEEIRGKEPHARVRLAYSLHDDRVVLLARTVVIDKPIDKQAGEEGGPAEPAAFVRAVSLALAAAVDQVTHEVNERLRAIPPPPLLPPDASASPAPLPSATVRP